jgi:hypothetical protein
MTGQLIIHGEIKIFMSNKMCYVRKSFNRTQLDQTVKKASIPAVIHKRLVRFVISYSPRYELLLACSLHV